jgi:hypothetical protein
VIVPVVGVVGVAVAVVQVVDMVVVRNRHVPAGFAMGVVVTAALDVAGRHALVEVVAV